MGGFIAERDGQALGIVHWVLHRTTWSAKDICYLQDLFTVAEARGSGVGRKLIEAVRADGAGEGRLPRLLADA
jgi:GNAT superfamily N-acetyltransferase